jgi:hypothetical protein
MVTRIIPALLLIAVAAPAAAQNEAALKSYFEGKRITVRMDMPGDADGVDGGGFGTFGDDTTTSANIPLIEKSSRERELEKRIKDEDDRDRRHRLDVGSALAEYVDFGERPAARPPAFQPGPEGALPGRIGASFRHAGELGRTPRRGSPGYNFGL